jgi:hypothetical protein
MCTHRVHSSPRDHVPSDANFWSLFFIPAFDVNCACAHVHVVASMRCMPYAQGHFWHHSDSLLKHVCVHVRACATHEARMCTSAHVTFMWPKQCAKAVWWRRILRNTRRCMRSQSMRSCTRTHTQNLNTCLHSRTQ